MLFGVYRLGHSSPSTKGIKLETLGYHLPDTGIPTTCARCMNGLDCVSPPELGHDCLHDKLWKVPI